MLSKEPLTPSGNPEEDFLLRNAEALQKIAIFADLSEGFTVGFVEVNLERDRNFTIRALESSKKNPELQWISLHFDDPDLHYLIAAITDSLQNVELIPDRKTVLLISGLEKTIGGYGDYPPLLSNLNIARDTYGHKLPYPILFLLPSYAMTRFARFAPDFWAWKSIEVRLQSDIPTPERSVAQMSIIPNDQIIIPVSLDRFDLLHRLIEEYSQPTLTRADLLNQLGQAYESHIKYVKAEQAYQESLKLYSALNNDSQKAEILTNLAGLYDSQGRYKEAEFLFKQALSIRRELFGDHHPDVATSLNNLALIDYSQGRYEEAESLFKQSLKLRQELLGDHHPDVATSLNNLAELYRSQGKDKEAEPLLKQSLELRQELFDDHHPNIATILSNLAELYHSQGRYEESEPLSKKALALYQELLGDSHPDVATSLNNLASLYHSQGRYEEAETLYQKALTLMSELLRDEHPDVAKILNNFAALRYNQNLYDEAEALFLQALKIQEAVLSSDHPHTRTTRGNYEICLKAKKSKSRSSKNKGFGRSPTMK
ncbi:tetratricopeptide repeat protein [Pseudanabaena sp. BC1403]|uniref:tetratricopeptide repeat protein n=1 Tax=Pseudanabaena sp. BC1403 TaxID=2043171 RepID=UPI000CD86DCF|nr:tetratricopeptide repeat protein [Pseudanabaena sp. BC1403]